MMSKRDLAVHLMVCGLSALLAAWLSAATHPVWPYCLGCVLVAFSLVYIQWVDARERSAWLNRLKNGHREEG